MTLAASVPPLAPHPLMIFLLDVTALLLLARVLGRAAQALGMPRVVGELVTGVLLGPSLLGHVAPRFAHWLLSSGPEQVHLVDAIGQLGLLLLVGVTGAHLEASILRRQGGTAVRVSLGGLIIPLGLGIALGWALPASVRGGHDGQRVVFTLFLGVAMAVTAIPVISKILTDMRLLHRNVGQLTLAAGMIDDAVGWFLLSVVSAAATTGVSVAHVGQSVLYLLGFLAVAVVAGRPAVRRVMRLAARWDETGPTVAAAVTIVLIGAATTQALGMEPVFGAFVAGILVGAPGAADQVKLAPLRSVVLAVLAPLFLATAGLRMDLTELRRPVVALCGLAVLAVAIVGKFVGAYLGARSGRLSHWEGLALGAGMNARGVVEVIVALTGLRLGVLNTAMYTVIVLVAIVTSLMTPPLLRVAMARVAQNEEERLRKLDHDAWDGRGHVQPAPSMGGARAG